MKTSKFFNRGFITGVIATIVVSNLIQALQKPEPIDYITITAQKGDTLWSICQEEYSSETRDKLGINYILSCIKEENADGKLEVGEELKLPIFE